MNRGDIKSYLMVHNFCFNFELTKYFFSCLGGKDAFVLCRIFEKSGLGPPNGDRYAPFIEEEWEDEAAFLVPGGEAEEEVANGDDVRIGASDFEKVCSFFDMYSVPTRSGCFDCLLYVS